MLIVSSSGNLDVHLCGLMAQSFKAFFQMPFEYAFKFSTK